jgi:hypothetical protein
MQASKVQGAKINLKRSTLYVKEKPSSEILPMLLDWMIQEIKSRISQRVSNSFYKLQPRN